MKRIHYEILESARGCLSTEIGEIAFEVLPGPADPRLDPRVLQRLVELGLAQASRSESTKG